jgi:multidrug efflux system membrane fusion protein
MYENLNLEKIIMKASRFLNTFGVAAIALILLTACSKPQEHVAQPTPVTVWTVANTAGENGLRYSANIKPDVPDVQVDLAFKASGYVEEIFQMAGVDGRRRNVQEGDFIKKGTVLAHVRANEYRDRVAEAQAGLTKAKSDFDRAAKLFENQSVSKADYDAAYAGYTSAQARYDQAAQALRDCALQAPMDGYVLRRRDPRLIEGSGFLGVDGISDYDEAKMHAYIQHYVKEHLRSAELHPDGWPAVVIRDTQ